MDLSTLDLGALSRALDDSDPDREHFLDEATGSLWTFVFSQATDETRQRYEDVGSGGWLRIPSPSPLEAYEEAEDFVDAIRESEVQDSLFGALEKRGSLKDFREELMRYPEMRANWLSLRRRRSRERLEAFLAARGLEVPPSIPEVAS